MDTQPLPLASLSLTHVTYNPADKLSYLSAWLALVPQGLVVVYVTLMWASREFEICAMFAGQMACEGLNFVLKRWIREERPAGEFLCAFLCVLGFCWCFALDEERGGARGLLMWEGSGRSRCRSRKV